MSWEGTHHSHSHQSGRQRNNHIQVKPNPGGRHHLDRTHLEKAKFWVNLPSDEITVEGGNPSVSSTIEPRPVEDCPLILIHEQSQLKRANEFTFSTEWKVCKMEQPRGNGCLYTRLPNTERIEDMIYCISIGTPSQDSTCCMPKENNDRVCTDVDGKTYKPDERWTCTDGCNTCKCTCSPERGCS